MSQLREFAQRIDDFKKLDVHVIAITADDQQRTKQVSRKVAKGKVRILSDPLTEVIRQYGLLHQSGGGEGVDIAIRATIFIGADGRERWRRVSTSKEDFPKADEILARIKAGE